MDIVSWKPTVEVLGTIITSGGIVVAGIGAYYRFFKGRVFHTRLALTVAHSWVQKEGTLYLSLTPTVQNTGISNVHLEQSELGEHFLEIWQTDAVSNANQWEICRWHRRNGCPVFQGESNIEAGESISEEHLIIVPNGQTVTLKITFGVRARKNPWRSLLRRKQDYHYWKCEQLCSPLETVRIES